MRIAFLGLGLMGGRMATHLLGAGHDVVVWNRTPAKAAPLLAAGARGAPDVRAAVADAEVVVTMLSTPDVVREVALGPDGFLPAVPRGALWIDASTVDPDTARASARAAAAAGARHLDAPVSGSTAAAEGATLLFLVGGEREDVRAAEALFAVMGRAHVHAGGHGQGAALKLVVNQMLGISMAAFAEALALGGALGLPRDRLLDVLLGSPVTAPILALKRERIERGDFSPEFPLRWMRKDLHLAAACGWAAGLGFPVLNAAKELYGLAERDGRGEQDLSAVVASVGPRPSA